MLFPNHVSRLQEIEPEISGGTTAVVAVLMDDWLYVANAGDSRAVLVQEVECDENQLYSTQVGIIYNKKYMYLNLMLVEDFSSFSLKKWISNYA